MTPHALYKEMFHHRKKGITRTALGVSELKGFILVMLHTKSSISVKCEQFQLSQFEQFFGRQPSFCIFCSLHFLSSHNELFTGSALLFNVLFKIAKYNVNIVL